MKKGLVLVVAFILFTGGIYFFRIMNIDLFKKINEDKKILQKTVSTEKPVEQIFLKITKPLDKSTVDLPDLDVSGKTLAYADVFVNDKQLKADSRGFFSTSIILDEGENNIIIVVNDSVGNYSEKELTVFLETSIK